MRKPSLLAVALRYVVLVAMALVIIVPLATTVMNGFKSNAEVIADPVALPSVLLWANYGDILAGSAFWRQMLNSTIVMAATTLGTVALAAMAAFVFARIQFRGREYIYNFILIGLLFPTTVAILPLYITLRQAGLLNSLMGVILPQIAFGLPTSILILRGFFAAVPLELEQAATIDGCSRFRFFFSILLPLTRSALAAVAVLVMVGSWNAYFLPLLVLTKDTNHTLPLGTAQFQSEFSTNWALTLAYVSLSLVPAILFYLLAQRQMIDGLSKGAIKG
jgi:raffinose/stachyose/melibiose transport system permease protein